MALISRYVCRREPILDIGCGSGNSIRLIVSSCSSCVYVVGVDVDFEGLLKAKTRLPTGSCLIDLVCCDASTLPFRSAAFASSTMILTLHEIDEKLVDKVLDEVWRALRVDGVLFFADKLLFEATKPSEELTLLVEEIYHKVVEHATGIRPWGLRRPTEYVSKLTRHGFELRITDTVRGKYLDCREFLSSWGKNTLKLLEQVKDEVKKKELTKLLDRVRDLGSRYGFR